MSDTDNDIKPETAAAAGGFTPEPPPPQLDAAAASDALADEQQAGESGSVTVPNDTAKRALEAVHILVENNRAASQQLESLMGIVLDAAEVANRSASAVATTGGQLNKAAEHLVDGAKKTATQSKIILTLAASVLVGTAGTFSFMTVQLHDKVTQVDAMLLAVGKRAVDLKTRMEAMDDIHTALAELNLKQDNTQSVQQAIEDKMAAIAEAAKSPKKETPVAAVPAPAPAAVARKSEPAGKSLSQQLSGLDALLKEQSKAVQTLSTQVDSVQGAVANVDGLKKDVETLAMLQRQRNQDAAAAAAQSAAAAAAARRDKEAKDRERELMRERELARERELMRERDQRDRELAREQARERELAKERELARERELAGEQTKEKDRAVQYSREQSKPNGSTAANGLPSYNRQSGTQAQ